MTDPNSRLGLLVAGYEKALQDLLTQIITHWQARLTACWLTSFQFTVVLLSLHHLTNSAAAWRPCDYQHG